MKKGIIIIILSWLEVGWGIKYTSPPPPVCKKPRELSFLLRRVRGSEIEEQEGMEHLEKAFKN